MAVPAAFAADACYLCLPPLCGLQSGDLKVAWLQLKLLWLLFLPSLLPPPLLLLLLQAPVGRP
jgi:hypothetical protein